MNPGSGIIGQQQQLIDPNLLFQSMFGDQQQQNLGMNNSSSSNNNAIMSNGNRFEFAGSTSSNTSTLPAGGMPNATGSVPEMQGSSSNNNAISNATAAMMQLPSTFFSDARLLMAQNHFPQSMNFPGLLPQQQQPPQQQQAQGIPELPLPSPHSLFHRDGSRRMRGGVIEPFPVSFFSWWCWRRLDHYCLNTFFVVKLIPRPPSSPRNFLLVCVCT
jgi:hypothetical protein